MKHGSVAMMSALLPWKKPTLLFQRPLARSRPHAGVRANCKGGANPGTPLRNFRRTDHTIRRVWRPLVSKFGDSFRSSDASIRMTILSIPNSEMQPETRESRSPAKEILPETFKATKHGPRCRRREAFKPCHDGGPLPRSQRVSSEAAACTGNAGL